MAKPVVQKKVCLLGDFAVGKTSLIRRFVEGRFDDKYLSTIGVKISRKALDRPDHTLNLILWDLAGEEDFDRHNRRYLLGAAGALIVCDLTRPETLPAWETFARRVRDNDPETAIVLLANKSDLEEERGIDDETLEKAGLNIGRPWLLTSAKTGLGVDEAFRRLAEQLEGDR